MEKPEKIVAIEAFYGIKLSQIATYSELNTIDRLNKNKYILDQNDEIVYLNLSRNSIKDIGPVANIPSLKILDLSYNAFDFVPLFTGLDNLIELRLYSNLIKAISNLEFLPKLEKLYLGSNRIETIENIEDTVLRSLYIQANNITSISGLRIGDSLQVLNVSRNPIVDLPVTTDAREILHWVKKHHKPKAIMKIEERLGIELEEIKFPEGLYALGKMKTYSLNKKLQVVHLNLDSQNLDTIDFWGELRNLKKLSLSVCGLKDILFLKNLKQIEALNLAVNDVVDIGVLKGFDKLRELQLSHNKIVDIRELYTNENIEILTIVANGIKDLPHFEKLEKLDILSASYNEITDLSSLKDLPKLSILYLGHNKITDCRPLMSLPKLFSLELSNNPLKNLPFVNDLSKLTILDISSCKIKDISPLAHLLSLTKLSLHDNDISDISPIYNLNLTNITLKGNPIVKNESIPEEDLNAGWQAIKNWLIEERTETIQQIKVLLLGNTLAGKSSLLECLQTEKPTTKQLQDRTHGILYKKVKLKGSAIQFHFWDFGGQEYYHATHKLFFSPNAINVILWSAKNNDTENWDLDYWLRSIDQLNGQRQSTEDVVVIESKIDENGYTTTSPLKLGYNDTFDQKLDLTFFGISMKPELRRLQAIKEILIEKANQNKLVKEKRSKRFSETLNKVLRSTRKFLTLNDFNGIEKSRIADLNVIHNMGIIVYFESIIPDKIFNKPDILLNFIYHSILSNENKFTINQTEIAGILANTNELQLTAQNVIDLLKEFDLVFQIAGIDTYFIPQYLPSKPAWLDFIERYQFSNLSIRLQSDAYLMNVILLKLFSIYGSSIKKDRQDYLFWRNGLIIEKDNQLLLIRFNRDKQSIDLLNSVNNDNFQLQKEVIDTLLSSLAQSEKNTIETQNEMKITWSGNQYLNIEVTVNGENFAKWEDIQMSRSRTFLSNGITFNRKDFRQFLDNDKMPKRIFISYSKDDFGIVNSFIESLVPLILEGIIEEPWFCSYLSPGDEAHNKIREKMEDADIVCFMCSNNFFRTSYIIENELKPTLKRKSQGGMQLILPVIIDRTKWNIDNDELRLGNFAAFPYRGTPVSDFRNPNDAWYVMNWFLEKVIKANKQYDNSNEVWADWLEQGGTLSTDIKKLLERQMDGKLNH